MNAGQFIKRLAMIKAEKSNSRRFQRRAMKMLVREAKAERILIGEKLAGWRLPGGKVVCRKRRYREEEHAAAALAEIQAHPLTERVPTRFYHCPLCRGFHLTSQPPQADNDN